MSGPFEAPQALDEAIAEHMGVIAEVRSLRTTVEAQGRELLALRTGLSQVQTDVLRAIDAATVASCNSELVLGRLADLTDGVKTLLVRGGNGHA